MAGSGGNRFYGRMAYAYIYSFINNDYLFMPAIPEERVTQITSNITDNVPMGRSRGVLMYTGSDTVSYSIKFDINAEMVMDLQGKNPSLYTDLQVSRAFKEYLDKLKALPYPAYSAIRYESHKVYIKIGTSFELIGMVKSCEVAEKKPVDRYGNYLNASVNLVVMDASSVVPTGVWRK